MGGGCSHAYQNTLVGLPPPLLLLLLPLLLLSPAAAAPPPPLLLLPAPTSNWPVLLVTAGYGYPALIAFNPAKAKYATSK